jgi:uncharacterized protein YxjI
MLNRSNFLIKEKVSFLKLSDTYEIFDPQTGEKIGYAKENIHIGFKLLRLLINKMLLPTRVDIVDNNETVLFSLKKGVQFLTAKVTINDSESNTVGFFKSKLFSFGGGFHVFDSSENKVAEVKGDWKGWNFKFIGNNQNEIGAVTKKWAGLGKELFTSADNYMISINDENKNEAKSMLLLAAGLAIDIVYKEKR